MLPATVSTFSVEMKDRNVNERCTHIDTITVPVKTLSSVLASHLPEDTIIDFMSVDVEGFDFEAIKSNDWKIYRPTVICIESPTSFWSGDFKRQTLEIENYLNDVGYELAYHNSMDAFYKER